MNKSSRSNKKTETDISNTSKNQTNTISDITSSDNLDDTNIATVLIHDDTSEDNLDTTEASTRKIKSIIKKNKQTSEKSKYTKISSIEIRINNIKNILNILLLKDEGMLPTTEKNPSNITSIETESFLTVKNSSKININDIRSSVCKKTRNFDEIFERADITLEYIKSGSTGHTYKAITKNGKYNFAIKIVPYPKSKSYGTIYSSTRPENVELKMIKFLSYFVINGQTPHMVLPIASFNTSISHIVKDIVIEKMKTEPQKYKRYLEFYDSYRKGNYENYVSILISEWADGGDLLEFIRKNYKTMTEMVWRVIFYQILSVLVVIQNKYPSFRHNDLKANNILIKITGDTTETNSNSYRYLSYGKYFTIPNIGYQMMLWDFDFASIPELIDNDKVNMKWTDKLNIKPEKNKYYDLHFFFNTLINPSFFPKFYEEGAVPKAVIEFVHRVIPEQYRYGSKSKYIDEGKGRLMISKEITTPKKLLFEDEFFAPLRQ